MSRNSSEIQRCACARVVVGSPCPAEQGGCPPDCPLGCPLDCPPDCPLGCPLGCPLPRARCTNDAVGIWYPWVLSTLAMPRPV